ncbi:hypothetical protein [Bacteroides sp. 519]|uniref:hypothetical protein n=1 Tax=Bacteroides sp. 519 TaxID=2302937 RepID=UPI0013D8461B|nr:hypothetical protein [Bacteroides sp. 519]NDV57753.1 hypothetical protein [Bacteroides sp. 519]
MNINRITEDGRLWAIQYPEQDSDELTRLFNDWNNPLVLYEFFKENWDDAAYFKISSIQEAIDITIDESEILEKIVLDIEPDADLDSIFQRLSHYQHELFLEKSKGKMNKSWLRLYAIKLTTGIYIITGGAIKLTATMEEREHTRQELVKLEKVRNFLKDNGIVDEDGFFDYINE